VALAQPSVDPLNVADFNPRDVVVAANTVESTRAHAIAQRAVRRLAIKLHHHGSEMLEVPFDTHWATVLDAGVLEARGHAGSERCHHPGAFAVVLAKLFGVHDSSLVHI